MYKALFDIVGCSLEDDTLLKQAFTHPSYAEFHHLTHLDSYERLEFLGDAVLKLTASDILYKKYPDYTEGQLSKLRSFLVSDNILSELSLELGLNKFLLLSDSEEKSGGRVRISNVACAFEAMLGAYYLSGKEEDIKLFLNRVLMPKLEKIELNLSRYNAKEILQEYTQGVDKTLPEYIVVNTTGPAHSCSFEVEVYFQGKVLGKGVGTSKKSAQTDAAYNACVALGIVQ